MKKNARAFKILAAVTACSMLLLSGCSVGSSDETTSQTEEETEQTVQQVSYSDKAGSVKKSETVYVTLDNTGAVQSTIVTDWLHTDTAETYIEDYSDIEDITNIKSDVEPEKDGDKLIWNMPTTDLYYRGTTSKTLPVSISIKYYLDGTEMTADEIAGRSGKLEIDISMTNNMYTTETVSGKSVKVYNPVVAIGGMMLSETQFQNVTVENGKSVGDGSKEIALFVGMPGINETLGISELGLEGMEEIEFKDSFKITADVTDFSLGNMYFAVLPLSSLSSSITIPNSVEELKSSLTQLKEIEQAIETIDPNGFITSVLQNPEQLSGVADMVNEAVSLYEDNKALLELLPKYLTEENMQTISNLASASQDSDLQQLLTLLSNPAVQQFIKILPDSVGELNDALPLMQELSEDMSDPQVQTAVDNLPETLERLSALQQELNDNQELINGLSSLMTQENIDLLSSVLESSDAGDFVEKLEQYGVIVDNSDGLVERVDAMLKYSKQFGIFTESADDAETSLMFVMKTAQISSNTDTVTEETTEAEESFFQKLFG